MIINKTKKFSDFFTKSAEAREIKFLVLHHVQADSVDHAVAQFVEHKVSSHFLIDENGEVFSLVDENDIAYHAGISFWRGFNALNKNSIGIEFINKSPFNKRFEHAQMLVGVELCRYLIDKYSIDARNVVGHSDIAIYPQLTWLKACFSLKNIKEIFDCLKFGKKKFLQDSAKIKAFPPSLSGFLDRKQDPSHLFDWKFLAQHKVGIFPEISLPSEGDKKLFSIGSKDPKVKFFKEKLASFGYRVTNFNQEFDRETQMLVRVFNRRFNPSKFNDDADSWYLSSQLILDELQLNKN